MSFEAESTLQEQMAGPSRPRFTGWLTMAPEVDPTPAPAAPSAQPTVETNNATASGSSSAQPVASTHGFGYLGQQIKLPQRKKRRATFQVGSPGLSEDEGGSASSSLSSHASSDAPDFDVRASFAPMPVYGKKPNAAPLSSYQGVGDQGQAGTVKQSGLHNRAVADTQAQQSSSDDEADGLSFGGRRWKGKTVHAVELELEALRDERLMSHAPDAAYLASRLEGVRRNLEIEERKPSYVPYDEDFLTDDEEVALAPDASDVVRQLYPFQHPHVGLGDAPPMPHRPVSNASSVSLVEGETPHDLDFGLQFEGSAPIGQASQEIKIHDPDEVAMPPLPAHLAPHSAKQIDPAARAAALDSRIEVRALRRGDLEQVRDLHAFHGDSDRSPDHGETYTSTASFLLRLLVDDRHVCLVAVAKPIPEPAAPLPAAADLVGLAARRGEEADSLPGSPQSTSPASLSASDDEASTGLKSLQLDAARAAESSDQSSLSSSPGHGGRATTSSLFSAVGPGAGLVPTAPHTRMISPRGRDGRINNTPATSVFSDIFAERGATVHKPVLADLPGPTDMASAPVKKVMSIPPPRGADARAVEAETILGVVSAHLSVVAAPSEDHLWFGGGSGKKAVEDASALVDVHVLTLATAPEERGQGLGAKLLAALHAECMHKARHMAMRMRNPRAVPVVAPLSPRFIDESTLMASMGATGSKSPYLRGVVGCSLAQLRDSKPGGKYLARTFLEVHPSNMHAIALYRAHGFQAPADDTAAVKRGFYRGDTRIATAERTKRGGTDAWILQRFDGPIP